MTKMIRAACAATILAGGLCSVGCVGTGTGNGANGGKTIGDSYRNAVDPCYPERYNHAARQATLAPFAQQVHNGQVMNQTVFNDMFENGTDKLTAGGMAKLDSIARTRPSPDPRVYIQAAMDIPVTDANVARVAELRSDLEAKRGASIQRYLATVPTFAPVNYEIFVHNPATPGINAEMAGNAYRASIQGYRGTITGNAGSGALSTGGSSNLTVAPVINNAGAGAGAAPR